MADILPFRKPRASDKHRGNTCTTNKRLSSISFTESLERVSADVRPGVPR